MCSFLSSLWLCQTHSLWASAFTSDSWPTRQDAQMQGSGSWSSVPSLYSISAFPPVSQETSLITRRVPLVPPFFLHTCSLFETFSNLHGLLSTVGFLIV